MQIHSKKQRNVKHWVKRGADVGPTHDGIWNSIGDGRRYHEITEQLWSKTISAMRWKTRRNVVSILWV